MKETRIIKC